MFTIWDVNTSQMMIEHKFQGPAYLCKKCKEPERKHRGKRVRVRRSVADIAYHKAYDKNRLNRRTKRGEKYIIGIDGEGHDLPDGRHIYTLLCAVNEHGKLIKEVENQNGLSTAECVEMLLSLPRDSTKFIFMGSYDWTKIIEDLNDENIYKIMHPVSRARRVCLACKHRWLRAKTSCPECGSEKIRTVTPLCRVKKNKKENPLKVGFDWFNGSFTVAEPVPYAKSSHHDFQHRKVKWGRKTKVWDVFKFFQSSFVKAIEAWKVGTPEQVKRITEMKAKRGSFQTEDPVKVREYCREECHLLAVMMRKLLDACKKAGIDLHGAYFGAGSIASAFLKANNVKAHLGPALETLGDGLIFAVMAAYFGGRFENSIVGNIENLVYNRDIFSAYPYALWGLPCLTCGKWERVTLNVMRAVKRSTLAVVKFRVAQKTQKQREEIAWMPLPFRDEKGSICYPTGFEGWAWKPEIEAALRGWSDDITILEAYVYNSDCIHEPWKWLSDSYRKRCEWDKDGPGIVVKLGMNACAGKTMQSQGDNPPFKSWIIGGMITATTRSQALDAVNTAKDRWNVLAIATDGLFTIENLTLPKSKDTGTNDLKKPLGDWGEDQHKNGVFFVKPGMYFDDVGSIMRARGIGRMEMKNHATAIVEAFRTWDRRSDLKIEVESRRFYGARSSILGYSRCVQCVQTWPGAVSFGCPKCGKVGDDFRTIQMTLQDDVTTAYGRWDKRKIEIQFASLPKREFIHQGGPFGRMRIRDMNGLSSLPYLLQTTPEGLEARAATEAALEEPDWNDMDVEIE